MSTTAKKYVQYRGATYVRVAADQPSLEQRAPEYYAQLVNLIQLLDDAHSPATDLWLHLPKELFANDPRSLEEVSRRAMKAREKLDATATSYRYLRTLIEAYIS